MKHITIAIVGRPNVGKSALFNRICKKRQAIVEDEEGVTRDRLYGHTDFFGTEMTLIDTGGVEKKDRIEFSKEIRMQVDLAVQEADVLLWVIDGRLGLTAIDEEIAPYILHKKKPVYLVVNKIDNESALSEETLCGYGQVKEYRISSVHGHGVTDLLEDVCQHAEEKIENPESALPKVALIGRPNVGKSTLLNAICKAERSIVSDVPGTTRDSIDITTEHCVFIDTAGIRRKNKEHTTVEKFSSIRTERAMKRCDLALLLVDATQGLTVQEKHILQKLHEWGKGCILFVNKWDLIQGQRMEHVVQELREKNPYLEHVPILVGSAKTGRNLKDMYGHIQEVYQALHRRIPTGELNRFLERAVQSNPPPCLQGKRLQIFYITQASMAPLRFIFFVNYPKLLQKSYERYLQNQLRRSHPFPGAPISFSWKGRKSKSR